MAKRIVIQLAPDDFGRPRLKNVESGMIYVDVSCGDSRHQPTEFNIPGDWHTSTEEGEPVDRIRRDITFEIREATANE